MSGKKIIIGGVIILLLALTINIVSKMVSPDESEFISGDPEKVSYSDVRNYLKKVDFGEAKSGEYFKDEVINKYTLKFFKYLQEKFKDMTFEQHLEAVKKYLYDTMGSENGEKLMAIYRQFLDYEKRLAAELNKMNDLKSTGDFLSVLQMMRKMQVEIFGEKNADIIFGASIKAQEYPVRRAGIINDPSLYGKEKEEKLKKLNKEMWGDDGNNLEGNKKPYTRYTEKIETYSKDLSELSEAERAAMVKKYREEIFPRDVVQRLEEVDRQMDAEKQKEIAYSAAYKEIMNDGNLSESEKKDKIHSLQNTTFGEEADSVRRREEMEAGKTEMLEKFKIE